MAGEPSKPSFLWQAILILLPVAVLAVIGWVSLRQDKILAEHDAQQRAQVVADQLAPTLWTRLVVSPDEELTNKVEFEVNESGALIFPPSYDPTPEPAPLPLEQLSPEQARLWLVSQGSTSNALDAGQSFIDSKPPERFLALAHFQLGLQEGKSLKAAKSFDLVATQSPTAVGESGLPLGPLAQFKILEMQSPPTITKLSIALNHFISLDSFCSNVVYQPTLLTPFLLTQTEALVQPPQRTKVNLGTNDEAKFSNQTARTQQWETVQKWQRVWSEHERAREVYAAASEHLRASSPFLPIGTNKIANAPLPSAFWFTRSRQARVWRIPNEQAMWREARDGDHILTVTEDWFATRAGTNGLRFVCYLGSDLMFPIMKSTEHIPDYFGAGVELAGHEITAPAYWHNEYVQGSKGGGQYSKKTYSDKISTNLLASATYSVDGNDLLKVRLFLTNPTELYANQQSRAMWFGLLVIASTIAALIGLFAAWRAFHRQLRLAEMKSNFVSSVSHELRAPIASVRLMAESLERGKVSEPQKQNEYFRFIVQECRRLSSLIENVLDFSRIEQGRKQYEFEPTDLLALTRETVKLMEPYAEEKGVRLETSNLEQRTPNVELEVDGRAIQQALVNLIDNAIKHSAKGQVVRIGIETVSGAECQVSGENSTTATDLTPDTSHLALYVEDSGPGIPPKEHEKIFERFYRLGSELRRETQGVGIGLSIVRHIVEAHGGRVTVRSNVGEGSRFTIELPGKTNGTMDKHE